MKEKPSLLFAGSPVRNLVNVKNNKTPLLLPRKEIIEGDQLVSERRGRDPLLRLDRVRIREPRARHVVNFTLGSAGG